MVNLHSPIEMGPAYSGVVTKVVEQFSKDKDIEAILWYHDEPIWFVKKLDGDLVRRVQVAAFGTVRNGNWLTAIKLVPDVYQLVGTRIGTYISQDAIQEYIKTVDIYFVDDLRLRLPSEVEKDLYGALNEVWAVTEKLAIS